ncbi:MULTISPECIES: hypothetical protein [unclassified Sphingomonas]|jgi:hypothetical protein|uniref:hypothetical protein n=1 Tax=unclassified Sphingomonas TaxID=196159 RepID=UPI0022B7D7A2|nr:MULTISPECIES: hypothetical protein [unclassified Sphingomonas]
MQGPLTDPADIDRIRDAIARREQLDVPLERQWLREQIEDREALAVKIAEREARLTMALKAGGFGTWTLDLPAVRRPPRPAACAISGARRTRISRTRNSWPHGTPTMWRASGPRSPTRSKTTRSTTSNIAS